MDGNLQYPYEVEALANGEHKTTEQISQAQLRHLVGLLDGSDVSEIEVKRAAQGMSLVLRKAKAHESNGASDYQIVVPGAAVSDSAATNEVSETKHTVTAALVGIFHTWARPKGNPLIAVGDRVKIGQRVGTIKSLNVLNEVESPVEGRVVEIFAQDGQAVEYGQQLVSIESSEEA